MNIPFLIAHRGYPLHYPENTLESVEAALQTGACYVEIDIQLTADGIVVLFHDDTLPRTTNATGRLLDMNYDQLADVSAGEPGRFGKSFENVHIPRLKDFVALLKKWPDVTALIEIKEESLQAFGTQVVVETVIAELEPVKQQCIMISFDADCLELTRRLDEFPIAWVLHRRDQASKKRAEIMKPDYLMCNYKKLPEFVSSSHDALWPGPWQWMLYEIIDPELALFYAERGINFIETMNIGKMLEHPVLNTRKCFGS